ncbi:MAG: hypothetical protein CL569_11840 [Alphaproteobacteria bacterium]|nr:hypothetical protein [Alphaproteobacteria bacterium]|tara:strand:- start:837 stop:1334 length:498 start_codon:yes stop_codon:yes gene_type:complete
MIRTLVFLSALIASHFSTGSIVSAHDVKHGDITISHPWARASLSAKVKNGVSYMTLRNSGTESDRLIGVSTFVADRAELHAHEMKNNVMKMKHIEAIEIPAGGEVELKPGGLHVMLFGLRTPLQKSRTFPMTLEFESAGEVDLEVVIEAGASRGEGANHKMHKKE